MTQLALGRNENSYQVTGAGELKSKWFKNARQVGISAGASTPDYLIDEVKEIIESMQRETTA